MKKMVFVTVAMFLTFLATSSAFAALSDGLVAHWGFDNCDATDVSGNGYTGAIHGDPECVQGIQGKALRFNKVDSVNGNGCGQPGGDYISIPPIPAIWVSGFTVCAWAKFEANRSFERIIDFGNGRGDQGGLNVDFGREGTSSNLFMESWIDSDSATNTTTGRIDAGGIINGGFRFYCATINNSFKFMTLYIDGDAVQQKIGHEIFNVARTDNFIGHSNWCEFDPDFKGTLDEIYVYNRDLSKSEIQELMSGGCTATFDYATSTLHVPCLNLGTISWWLDLGTYSSNPFLLNITNFGVK